ncbi:N-glycosylase/DNA lyase [Candidatus Micrarchaeota archaeon]|nr:N-glycosylase/DNA lyase [Candidatus Micrarchaeota archaeon]
MRGNHEGKDQLLLKINKLKKSKIKQSVDIRTSQFKRLGKSSNPDKIFSELSFCILTANYNAARTIRIQKEINKENGFSTMTKRQLAGRLMGLGYRFPNTRADYIINARRDLQKIMYSLKKLKGYELRDWLVKNVKGLGYKEACHFLRNIGYVDYAIIDFHIIDMLVKYGLIDRYNTITKKTYLEIENVLREIAIRTKLNLAELDLYLWYMETGKILK